MFKYIKIKIFNHLLLKYKVYPQIHIWCINSTEKALTIYD